MLLNVISQQTRLETIFGHIFVLSRMSSSYYLLLLCLDPFSTPSLWNSSINCSSPKISRAWEAIPEIPETKDPEMGDFCETKRKVHLNRKDGPNKLHSKPLALQNILEAFDTQQKREVEVKTNKEKLLPIGSMGLIYLPT